MQRGKEKICAVSKKNNLTHDGTRTHNLALRRGTPYPLGHAGRDTRGRIPETPSQRHLGRVVKAVDSKSTGLCPRQFESGRCRVFANFCCFLRAIRVGNIFVATPSRGRWSRGMILALGARGRGFDSRTAPVQFFVHSFDNLSAHENSRLVNIFVGLRRPKKCLHPGSNWGPSDLQSDALPTEL